MRSPRYLRPTGLDDALAALAAERWTVVAGGTDHYPARVGQPLDEDLLDITGIAALGEIRREEKHWRSPALVTWSEIIADRSLPPLFDGLKLAAREVGGVQIQNAGTLCGNLCNASPAADGVPNLLALDAEVELASRRGTRRLAVESFVTGNRKTLRAPDELMTAILVPDTGRRARSTFLKLGARRYLVISIVMVGAAITLDAGGRIASAGIAVGACAPVAKRLPALELALIGHKPGVELARLVTAEHLAPLSPIDDVRGTADYRQDATLTLLRRTIAELCR
ncbi:MAG TPA: FAD binding domain-containing protein [Stellaceae bacterium]|nr:FAD binding domain-containing protein [Stellaceae bacterium]